MINGTMSDPNYPRLSIRVSLKQSIRGRHNILIDLKISGFNVDRHNLALVSRNEEKYDAVSRMRLD
jgi:hypothetical protein